MARQVVLLRGIARKCERTTAKRFGLDIDVVRNWTTVTSLLALADE